MKWDSNKPHTFSLAAAAGGLMGRGFSFITLHKKNLVGFPSEAVATNLHEELRWIKTGTQEHKTKNRLEGHMALL